MIALQLIASALAGAAVGTAFFDGLRRTVQRLPHSARPVQLLIVSFVARFALAAATFAIVGGARWERFLACLIGFLIARHWILARAAPTIEPNLKSARWN